ncbi:MAG: hypothetical protein WCX31_21075 [Salinivirgaceae bacterium]|jgi:hypothetical protein
MKKIVSIALFMLSFQSFSQVDEALKKMQLYEGSTYITYGHRITEVFSVLEFHLGVGLFPKTNIAYLNYQQLILLMQDTAKNEKWSEERYIATRNRIRTDAIGGRIILYVERFDQYETNSKMFFIIIRDTNENKLFEYNLPYRPADLITTDVFSNWAYININVPLSESFNVYVNNKLTDKLSDTNFLVEQNAAPLQK